jgi:cyclopropane fatty-acyl-phospholipid synthase-like methyltransferase
LTAGDLAPADEFHVGGREATIDFVAELHLSSDMHWLDIGSGIGGPSRYIANRYKCPVTGVDLHEEYIEVARSLSQRVGLGHMISYRQAQRGSKDRGDELDRCIKKHRGSS